MQAPRLFVGPRFFKYMAFFVAYTTFVLFVVSQLHLTKHLAGVEVTSVTGFVLGVLVAFRNNTANDRWWEARKIWGQLINDSRNLALKVSAHVLASREEIQDFCRLIADFSDALRLHLRGVEGIRKVPGYEGLPKEFPNGPTYVAGKIFEKLDLWYRAGQVGVSDLVFDPHARALMDACGACERIRNTPLPSSYRALARWGITLYAANAPWSLGPAMGWWALPILTLGFFFLLAMEYTASAIEEPFGTSPNDLPLESYCSGLRRLVMEIPAIA